MITRASLLPIGVFTAVGLLGVGGAGAWVAARLGFPYVLLTPVALLVYGFTGFFASKAGAAGWLAGAIVAFLDAASWATFGGVGPQPFDTGTSLTTRVGVVALTTALGAGGGWVGSRLWRRRTAKSHVAA